MEEPIRIRLHVISPTHIGCDDVYEPTSFVIDETKKKLLEFDPMEFIKNLTPTERERFSVICSNDDLLQIFKFIKNTWKYGIAANEVHIAAGLLEHYKKVLTMSSYNRNTVINQFTMNKTAFNPLTNRAYIPGSSLKGSLRTGYLSFLAVNKGTTGVRDKKNVEADLLGGKLKSDPFRMIKVSDFQPLNNVQTRIVYAINRKKKKSDRQTKAEGGPPQIFEVIEPGSVFEGVINIEKPVSASVITSPVDKKLLFNAVQIHYSKIYNQEAQILKECGFKNVTLNGFQRQIGVGCFLVRIGRHSGAEAVTIEGNRSIKIMQGQGQSPKRLPYATTIWLSSESNKPPENNGLIPFGWAILEMEPFDDAYITPAAAVSSGNDEPAFLNQREQVTHGNLSVNSVSPAVRKEPEQFKWKGATMVWSPGNKTLVATYEGRKAELQIGDDRSLVPEMFHKKLFEKKKGVLTDILVEPLGNAFRIVSFTEE